MSEPTFQEARFDFGHVVGETFGLIFRNFIPFALLAILLVGLPRFGALYVQAILLEQRSPLLAWIPLGNLLVTLITTYILQGTLTRASVDDLSKKGVGIGSALGDGLRYFFPLFIVALLTGIGVLLGFLFFVIPGIYLIVRWIVSAPAVVVEREGPTHSIGRSAELTEGYRWAVFGLLLLFTVFYYGMAIGIGVLLEAAGGAAGMERAGLMTLDLAGYAFAGATAGIEALASLVGTVGMASLYFELRRVKDGVGIDELAKVFE